MRRNSEASTTTTAMSSCRIERKRAHDREAQRASRAKTKAYIQHLEKTVADLTQSSGDGRSNYLAQHASKQSQEIESLQGLVGKIRSLVQEAGGKPEQNSPPTGQARLKHEGSISESLLEDSTTADLMGALWDSPPSEDQWAEVPRPVERQTKAMAATRNLIIMGINMLCEDVEDCSFFTRLNDVITKIEQTPDNLSDLDADQDILIRAIVSGWDAAERVHHFDIVWRFLRAFDEGLWYRAAPLERIANFWHMRNKMLWKIQPKNQERRKAAAFMSPTMNQKSSSNRPQVIDYFVWPQVRDGLLVKGIECCPGKSTIAFVESFRFDWPYDFRDVYKYNKRTGMYSFSYHFLETMDDIAAFKMLNNQLVPYYAHPGLAQVVGLSAPAETDSDGSIDGEISGTHDDIAMPSAEGLIHGAASADWSAAFPMDMSDLAGNYAYDPFPRADAVGLAQWPTF